MELLQVFNLIELSENFIKSSLQSDISDGHDFDHTCRVVKHALAIAQELPQADQQIVHLAALLHDVARPQEFQSQGKIDHAAAGAVIARDFLLQYTTSQIADRVAQAISQHRYRSGNTPSSLEAEILYDADKLDSLGAIGIARTFAFGGSRGRAIHDPAGEDKTTSIQHFYDKLLLLKDRMNTETGKGIARQRHDYMRGFLEQFYGEWDGNR